MDIENELRMPVHCYLMWRPKGGKFVEGETVVPWDNKYYKNWERRDPTTHLENVLADS